MRYPLLIGRLIALAGVVVLMSAAAAPSVAQMSASILGSVVDVNDEPIEGATVIVRYEGEVTREFESTTDANGRFSQLGLQFGPYSISARKEGVGAETMSITLRVGQRANLELKILPDGLRSLLDMSPEERAEYERTGTINAALEAGVAASRAGNYVEAIASFSAALETVPDCHECYHNIGQVYVVQEDWANAEQAFESALEINPEYAPSYRELSGVYNAQRRFDEAQAASARAVELGGTTAGGGDPDAILTQGLINWNAGNIADAKAQFEQVLELNPDHGEAHYWLGMAHLNEGQLGEAKAEFQRYVDLEPGGQYAEQANGMLAQLP